MPRIYTFKWTLHMLKAEALKYTSRLAFQHGSNNAYQSARNRKLLDQICGHMIEQFLWTNESAIKAAKKYKTRKDFQYGNHRGAYQFLRKHSLLNEACSHMPTLRRFQSDEELIAIARQHKTVTDLIAADPGVRSILNRRGLEQIAYAHMVAADTDTTSDYDAIYLWESDRLYNGLKVYKIGITSSRLGDRRIHKVATAAGMTAKIIQLRKTSCNALHIERQLKKIGTRPSLEWFNGYKEFRAMTPTQVKQAIAIIKEAA